MDYWTLAYLHFVAASKIDFPNIKKKKNQRNKRHTPVKKKKMNHIVGKHQ